MKRLLPFLCLATIGGCAAAKSSPKPSGLPGGPQMGAFFPRSNATKDKPRDPQADPKLIVELTVYKLTVPARSISHNEEFWKHVNEASIDVGQHDLLFSNGFRVGVAPRGDWDYFKKIIEKDSVTSQLSGGAGVGGSVLEMPFRSAVPIDTVMYLHPTKGLVGQIYERCDELMSVHFSPVPRQTGDVRVTAVPLFRSVKTELTYTAKNEAQPYSFIHPTYAFDLKLEVNVPLDNFLIIAPSSDADRAVSLGHKLLYTDSGGKEYETVLLLAPQPFQFEPPATQPNQTAEVIGK